ncbi:Amino acid adenylation domain-containing protein [Sulfidibacter corallicola]|uniref:Amino acid adenylation domain-containing protein n=1 Tax=Sulfidibacter corallicola TaxID=2818388 RepID=A0A8A4U0H7_SULCO|nr:non-ribosomal peptide synthetase/type I polyketide synthase [Sulfidibacter corallicola]QTD52255.1 amino acid adenylation domain-containing protein [Sulfidibacter corallicola]
MDHRELLKKSLLKIQDLERRLSQAERREREPIAIVGMGCRLPGGARDPSALWDLLIRGVDATGEVPAGRWRDAHLYDPEPERPGKFYTRRGGFLDGVDRFDASFFRITPREAEAMDPQQRLLLEVAWEALEHACMPPDGLYGQVGGVFVGITRVDYGMSQLLGGDPRHIDAYSGTGSALGVAAGRLSFVLGLTGPSFAVDTACSSSLVALHQACTALRRDECRFALAGGVNLLLRPELHVNFCQARMLAPDGRCKTFDSAADGLALSEGAGILVLKRLRDARADGDRVLAVIRGSAINQDGPSGGLTVPNGPAQVRVIRAALAQAGLRPDEVDLIEAHGTGTALGDPIEMGSLGEVFADRGDAGPLVVGSLKTNFGHMESAAGVSGVIKLVLALQHETVPPHLHFHEPNPRIAWSRLPIEVPVAARCWPRGSRPRIAGVSGFGVSGTNAHLILAEAPPVGAAPIARDAAAPAASPGDERAAALLLCARSEGAVRDLAARYADRLEATDDATWRPLCHAASRYRTAFEVRVPLAACDRLSMVAQLRALAAAAPGAPEPIRLGKNHLPRLLFLFSGQGCQFAGMARRLYEMNGVFRETLDRCAAVLDELLPQPLSALLFAAQGDEAIHDTGAAQPALFALQAALAAQWRAWGVEPDVVLGHSVGQYAAARVADVFSLEDGLRLIARRGALMSALPREGCMASVMAPESEIVPLLAAYQGRIEIAARNAPAALVLSGESEAVRALTRDLKERGITVREIKASHAFHSHLMEPMLEPFRAFAAGIEYRSPRIPLVGNEDGLILEEWRVPDGAWWANHCRAPVAFAPGLRAALGEPDEAATTLCVELGPRPVLLALGRQSGLDPACWLPSLDPREPDDLVMARGLATMAAHGVAVDWDAFYGAPAPRMDLPLYPFQRKRHWLPESDAGLAPPDARQAVSAPVDSVASSADPVTQAVDSAPDESGVRGASDRDLRAEVIELVAELMHMEPGELDPQAEFLEMGADSLLLMDAIQVIKRRFGIELTMRQFFEDVTHTGALAAYIEARVPARCRSVEATRAPETVSVAQPTSVQASVTSTTGAAGGDPVAQVVLEQLALMRQQLTMLGGHAGSTAMHTALEQASVALGGTEPAPSTPSNAPHTGDGAPVSIGTGAGETGEEARLSPLRALRAKPASGLSLTEAQQSWLNGFVGEYTARTARSKAEAQRCRPGLADSRASFGFRFSTKEMLYPIVGDRADGAHLTDIDGNEYVDLTMGFGSLLFGNHPEFVHRAVVEEMGRGTQVGPRSRLMAEVAERFVSLTGVERVAFTNSGTEAVMTAIRMLRTVTGRTRIALFEGAYHGHADTTLIGGRMMSGEPHAWPMAPGVPDALAEQAVVLPWNDDRALEYLRRHAGELAAVLVEPVQSRRPDVQPVAFLRELRALTRAADTPLLLDEMITGFRTHPGGIQALWGVEADVVTYGKVIGGGLPIGVLAGKARYLDAADGGLWAYGDTSFPGAEKTYFAGTFCQHPHIMAAARAVLQHLQDEGPELQETLTRRTRDLVARLNGVFAECGVAVEAVSFASWFLFRGEPDLELFHYHLNHLGVFICEGRSCFVATSHSDADLDRVVAAVRETCRVMVAQGFWQLQTRTVAAAPRVAAKPAEPAPKQVALSEAQRQLWLVACLDEAGSRAYHETSVMELRGPLQVAHLKDALRQVVARHEALRMRILVEGSEAVQEVFDEVPVDLPMIDLSEAGPQEADAAADAWLLAESERGLDPTATPWRFTLLRLHETRHLLVYTAHHLFSDGWSIAVVWRDLCRIYKALAAGEAPELPPASGFRSFLAAQRTAASDGTWDDHRRYWSARFGDRPEPLQLPTVRPRPANKSWHGARLIRELPADLLAEVRQTARRKGMTPFFLLLGAFTALLHRLSGQARLVVGTPTANRDKTGMDDMVGYCTHLLPILSEHDGDPRLDAHLAGVKRSLLDAFDHAALPFAELLAMLEPEHEPSRAPLLDVVFNFEVPDVPDMGELEIAAFETPLTATAFDLTLSVMAKGGTCYLECDYQSDLFDETFIASFLDAYRGVLVEIAGAESDPRLSQVPLLTKAQSRAWLVDWNRTERLHPPHRALGAWLEESFACHADRVALRDGDTEWTFAQLEAQTARLASVLRDRGVGSESVVALCLPRGRAWLVSLLAVLRAGGAWLPLDPAWPEARLTQLLHDASPTLVLGEDDRLLAADRVPWLAWSQLLAAEPGIEPGWRSGELHPEQLAYVLYTSGSTGRPKGVAVSRRALLTYLTWSVVRYDSDGLALLHGAVGFDATLTGVFAPLLTGRTLQIVPPGAELDALCHALSEPHKLGLLKVTPAHLESLSRLLGDRPVRASVASLIVGGEAFGRRLAEDWRARLGSTPIVNEYGPTETTVGCAAHWFTVPDERSPVVSIGRPLSACRLYVVDAALRPLPPGVPGELLIGGEQVARGYAGRAALTAECFVPDPFGEEPGARLYRSGDRVRLMPSLDGGPAELVFLDRIDRQVKVQGYRVEPAEVEAALTMLDNVAEAMVFAIRPDGQGHCLAAAVVPAIDSPDGGTRIDGSRLARALGERVPHYMVPARWLIVERLPLTANGKRDRDTLRLMALAQSPSSEPAPMIGVEVDEPEVALLVGIWCEILKRKGLGPDSNFFECGGHSLSATKLIGRVHRELGVLVPLKHLFDAPTPRRFLHALRSETRGDVQPLPVLRPAPETESAPLSLNQQRLWFLDRLNGPGAVYNMPWAVRLCGRLDPARLERALAAVVARQRTLRTAFIEVDGEGVQVIRDMGQVDTTIPVTDLRELTGEARLRRVGEMAEAHARSPFDLAEGPLIRLHLLRLGETEWMLLGNLHHSAGDGWSVGLLVRELSACYTRPERPALPELVLHYTDVARWQRRPEVVAALAARLDYWRTKLAGAPESLALPTDRPRPARQSHRGDRVPIRISCDQASALYDLCQSQRVTPFMALLAGFGTLLARFSGSADLVIGTPVANRERPETAHLIGFFVNMLPLRLLLDDDMDTAALLAQVRRTCLEAYAHQELPFERLVDALDLQRDLSREPLFQAVLVLQNVPPIELDIPELTFSSVPVAHHTAKYDLTLTLEECDDQMVGELEFATDLFDRGTAERMVATFVHLLERMCAEPKSSVATLDVLDETQKRHLLVHFNQTDVDFDWPPTLDRVLAAQARRTPDAVALVWGEGASRSEMTYGELHGEADRWAAVLRGLGVGPESRVGVCAFRSVEMVVALLAVVKAGAAWVPLDPEYPDSRLGFVLEDAGVALILTQEALVARLSSLSAIEGTPLLPLDGDPPATVSELSRSSRAPVVQPDHLAYVIFTSGSTGKPKGAMNTHRAICNRLAWMQAAYGLDASDRVLQKTPYSFDVSVWEFFWPLAVGAALVVAEPGGHRDPYYLMRVIDAERITTLHFVPSMLDAFLEAHADFESGDSLARVICSGEALARDLQLRFHDAFPKVDLHNLYGPTEAAIDVSHWTCRPDDGRHEVPIGKAIANLRLYIVDRRGQPVPIGAPGELLIGGVGLARGYEGRPDLTAERFVPDPFGSPGDRVYRTGDLARFLPDGNILFLGRLDFQVKLRGFRIELGEIEAQLVRLPEVGRAVVTLRRDAGEASLVAWLVTKEGMASPDGADPEEPLCADVLRHRLLEILPEYMVPARFVWLKEIPLSANGKIDRRPLDAIPLPDIDPVEEDEVAERPQTPAAQTLASVWREVLDCRPPRTNDNFFQMGGDSIRAIRLVARAAKHRLKLELEDVFRFPHLGAMAAATEIVETESERPGEPGPFALVDAETRAALPAEVVDAYPLTRLQFGMLFHGDLQSDQAMYRDLFGFRFEGPFEERAFHAALCGLIAAHPVLRTTFETSAYREPLQLVYREVPTPLEVIDLRGMDSQAQEDEIERRRADRLRRNFSWRQAPLLAFEVLRLADDRFFFLVAFHHAILDGWSFASMVTELFRRYLSMLDVAVEPPTPSPELSFRGFVALEAAARRDAVALAFWSRELTDVPITRPPRFPTGFRRPADPSGSMSVEVPASVSRGLSVLADELGCPLKSVLLAVHLRALAHLLGPRGEVVTGLIANGRPERESAERVLGLFLNTLPFRFRIQAESGRAMVRRVLEKERALLGVRRVPLFDLQRLDGRNGAALCHVVFNYVDFHVYASVARLGKMRLLETRDHELTNFPLTANFIRDREADSVVLNLCYDPDRMDGGWLAQAAQVYRAALIAMVEGCERDVRHWPLGSPGSRAWWTPPIEAASPVPAAPVTGEMSIPTWPADVDPTAPAIRAGARTIDFAELERRVTHLATTLQREGVRPGVVVGLCFGRVPELVIAMWAVWRAGGAWLPLDPEDPPERLRFLVDDASAALILGDDRVGDRFGEIAATLSFDAGTAMMDAVCEPSAPTLVHPDDLAYVLYTSGSTGKPKGVAVTHASLEHYLGYARTRYTPEGGTLVHGAPGFDATLTSLFVATLVGAPLTLISETDTLSALTDWMLQPVDLGFLKVTPAHLEGLAGLLGDRLPACRIGTLIVGGDALPAASARAWRERLPGTAIVNEYGPTETVVGCAAWTYDGAQTEGESVPIGVPLTGLRLYLVDDDLRPVAPGCPGELLIGGAQLARGYMGRPAATAERFVPDPFGEEQGARLYRSGDRCRLLTSPDGGAVLEYLGRGDDQVKIRGFRVEPAELTQALPGLSGVVEGRATVVHDARGQAHLAACVVTSDPESHGPQTWRTELERRLPRHMAPELWVRLDALPLNARGKVDGRALAELARARWDDAGRGETGAAAVPLTETQRWVIDLFAEVLALDTLHLDDDFFAVGGHSLTATRVIARCRDLLEIELPLRALFDAPTPRAFAARLRQARTRVDTPMVPVTRGTLMPTSFAQQRLWFVDQLEGSHSAYNISAAIQLAGPLDAEALARAFAMTIDRHESLRTRFTDEDGTPYQVILEDVPFELERVDLSGLEPDVRAAEMAARIHEEADRPFDLAGSALIRVTLIALEPDRHLLLATLHHIVADGWSVDVLVRELAECYRAASLGEVPRLEPPGIQYADFAVWQRGLLEGSVRDALLAFWMETLDALPDPVLLEPDVTPVSASPERTGSAFAPAPAGFVSRRMPDETWTALRDFNRREGVTLFMTLLAVLDLLLWQRTGRTDLVVGTDVAGRDRAELEGLIGFFVNQLALRTRLDAEGHFRDLLGAVKRTTLAAYDHQELPFDLLVGELGSRRDGVSAAPFAIKLVLQHQPRPFVLQDLSATFLESRASVAKMDLLLNAVETGDGLDWILEFNAARYGEAGMQRLLAHVDWLLDAVIKAPERALRDLRAALNDREEEERVARERAAKTKNQKALKGRRARRRTGARS